MTSRREYIPLPAGMVGTSTSNPYNGARLVLVLSSGLNAFTSYHHLGHRQIMEEISRCESW
jgi:hypothetical protein